MIDKFASDSEVIVVHAVQLFSNMSLMYLSVLSNA